MVREDPWYEIVEGEDLEQGDFIDRCPIFIPYYSDNLIEQLSKGEIGKSDEIPGEWQGYNVIVMSQTCDIVQGKLNFVLVCPYWSLEDFGQKNANFLALKMQEEIRRGNQPGYHMLNACQLDEMRQGIQIVEFRSTYSIPYVFLKQLAKARGKRLRLRSPYKEKLSQAFGNLFARVALPIDIPSFQK